jgi:hypothetical protein
MKLFSNRLAQANDIAAVKALIAEAAALAREARQASDLRLLRMAVEHDRRAARRGGELLGDGGHHPAISDSTAARWRLLAKMTDEIFERHLCNVIRRQAIRPTSLSVQTLVSAWAPDERGFPTRTIATVEADAAAFEKKCR